VTQVETKVGQKGLVQLFQLRLCMLVSQLEKNSYFDYVSKYWE
jgi:hypothetical protein